MTAGKMMAMIKRPGGGAGVSDEALPRPDLPGACGEGGSECEHPESSSVG